jgi:calcium-dependent protein kinase
MIGYDQFFGKNMDKAEIEKMFDSVDIDGSGFIDYSEFVIASMNEKNLLTNEKLQSAFKMFDKVRFLEDSNSNLGRQWIHIL